VEQRKDQNHANTPDLLTDQLGSPGLINPLAQEQLAQERVERLLLATQLLVTRRVLLLQGAKEPFEHKHAALLLVLLSCGCNQDGWHFGPVRRELGQRRGGQDESWGGEGGEIAIEGCYRLLVLL
jgi:hypothetical protein